MKRLVLILALGFCAAAAAQTPRYLPANGCTTAAGGKMSCTSVSDGQGNLLANSSSLGAAVVGFYPGNSVFMILGDSKCAGSGSGYVTGWAYETARSLMNHADQGPDAIRGYEYPTAINLANALSEPGITSNGTVVTGGVTNSRLSLAAGQAITITQHNIAYADVFYDGALSTGSVVVAYNGTTMATTPVTSTAGIKSTGVTFVTNGPLLNGIGTLESDTITITATGGTVVVTGIQLLRSSSESPLGYLVCQAGTSFADYLSTAVLDELGVYLNAASRSTSPKTMIIELGTNSIYNAGKAQSPAAMIASLTSLIAGINARTTGVGYILEVPSQANPLLWPIIQGGFTYTDYVNAMVSFAKANNYGLVRLDKSLLSNSGSIFYADGLHYDLNGALIAAGEHAAVLGVPLNSYLKTAVVSLPQGNTLTLGQTAPAGNYTVNCTTDSVIFPLGTGTTITLPTCAVGKIVSIFNFGGANTLAGTLSAQTPSALGTKQALILEYEGSGGWFPLANDVLPATVNAAHGTSTQVQLSDGTGVSAPAAFDASGNLTSGTTVPTKSGTPTVGAGVCWKTASVLGTCTAGTWPNCSTCN